MAIKTNVHEKVGSVHIDGKFDFFSHREFTQSYARILDDPAIQEIEVNLQRTDFIDSAALGMLMLLRERAQSMNKELTLSYPSPEVSKLLWVANFDKLFTIKGFDESVL